MGAWRAPSRAAPGEFRHGRCLPQQPGPPPGHPPDGAPVLHPVSESRCPPSSRTRQPPAPESPSQPRRPVLSAAPWAAPRLRGAGCPPHRLPQACWGSWQRGCLGVPSSAPSRSEHTFEQSVAGTRVASHGDGKGVAREGHRGTGLRFAPRGPPCVGQWAEGHLEAWAMLRGPLTGEWVMLPLVRKVWVEGPRLSQCRGERGAGRGSLARELGVLHRPRGEEGGELYGRVRGTSGVNVSQRGPTGRQGVTVAPPLIRGPRSVAPGPWALAAKR